MGLSLDSYISLLCVLMILLPSLCYSQESYISSRATYYGNRDSFGTRSGACGYNDYGSTINDGEVTGVSKLFKDGTGCGACYQVRCKNSKHCSEDGAIVVVTDHGEGDNTDFILSSRAYNKLALQGQADTLFSYGVVDIEYKRIPCQYPGKNLLFKVHEYSRFPQYLALIAIYQGGVSEITAVELWQEDRKEWRGMRRAYGAVWDMPTPPQGSINLRFQVSGCKWIELKNFIASIWKAGDTYNTNIQLN